MSRARTFSRSADHLFVVPDFPDGGVLDVAQGVIAEEVLGAGQDRAVPEDDQGVPEEGAGGIVLLAPHGPGVPGPVVQLLDVELVERQALEAGLEGLQGAFAQPLEDLGEIDQLDEGDRLAGALLFLELQEAEDVGGRLVEVGVDPDRFVAFLVQAVEGEGELVQAGVEKLPGLVLVQQGAVGVEAGDDPGVVGVADHLEEVGVEERFAAVQQVDVGDEALGLVDDLLEQIEIHEPLLLLGQLLVGAHDAAQVADAGGLDPQADGHVGQAGLAALVGAVDLAEASVIGGAGHGAIL